MSFPQNILSTPSYRPLPSGLTRRQRPVGKRVGALTLICGAGKAALKNYNPKDQRTHPMVREIIENRGDRAGFFIKDGILFQLTTGFQEFQGVASYYPVRGASLADSERFEKIFGPDWIHAIFNVR